MDKSIMSGFLTHNIETTSASVAQEASDWIRFTLTKSPFTGWSVEMCRSSGPFQADATVSADYVITTTMTRSNAPLNPNSLIWSEGVTVVFFSSLSAPVFAILLFILGCIRQTMWRMQISSLLCCLLLCLSFFTLQSSRLFKVLW